MKRIPLSSAQYAPASGPTASIDPRWRLGRLLSAPHRLGFFTASMLLTVSGFWWALVLGAREAGVSLPWAVAPPLVHGLFMAMGFMPLFMVGFLFTAGPRWLGMPEVDARGLLAPVVGMVFGWVLALAGFHWRADLAALGVAIVASAWSAIAWRFFDLCRRSKAPDKLHAHVIGVSIATGALALWVAALSLWLRQVTGLRVATQMALWCCLAPTFATVSHRMIPFFTAGALPTLDAWRPNWLLWAMLAALGVCGAGAIAELLVGPLPASLHGAQVAVQGPAAILLLWLAMRWGLLQSLKVRLLAMLHGGFLWLGLAMALAALSHALVAAGREGLGLAPTHALTMGYLGATLFAMITRVTAGHSGRPLAVDRVAWVLYWGLQFATVARVGAALRPEMSRPLILLAVTAWVLSSAGWTWRYGGWLGRARIDGRPG